MLEVARDIKAVGGADADALARIIGMITQLGRAGWPCGLEEPPIVSLGDGTCGVLIDNGGDPLTPDELRGYAVRLLQLADDAEERTT